MRRFYSLDILPNLFGGFLLMKQWARIGGTIMKSWRPPLCNGKLRGKDAGVILTGSGRAKEQHHKLAMELRCLE
jgi:hypothetical protein